MVSFVPVTEACFFQNFFTFKLGACGGVVSPLGESAGWFSFVSQ